MRLSGIHAASAVTSCTLATCCTVADMYHKAIMMQEQTMYDVCWRAPFMFDQEVSRSVT